MSRKQRRSSLTSRASDHVEGGVGQRTAGWLLKKASSHGMWQPRYFALIGHYLMYAKKKSKRGSAQSWEGGVELRGKEAVIARAKIDGHAALRITGLDGQLDNHDDVLRTMELREYSLVPGTTVREWYEACEGAHGERKSKVDDGNQWALPPAQSSRPAGSGRPALEIETEVQVPLSRSAMLSYGMDVLKWAGGAPQLPPLTVTSPRTVGARVEGETLIREFFAHVEKPSETAAAAHKVSSAQMSRAGLAQAVRNRATLLSAEACEALAAEAETHGTAAGFLPVHRHRRQQECVAHRAPTIFAVLLAFAEHRSATRLISPRQLFNLAHGRPANAPLGAKELATPTPYAEGFFLKPAMQDMGVECGWGHWLNTDAGFSNALDVLKERVLSGEPTVIDVCGLYPTQHTCMVVGFDASRHWLRDDIVYILDCTKGLAAPGVWSISSTDLQLIWNAAYDSPGDTHRPHLLTTLFDGETGRSKKK